MWKKDNAKTGAKNGKYLIAYLSLHETIDNLKEEMLCKNAKLPCINK